MLYDGMNVIKDGATDYELLEKWPQSPQYWGYDSWSDVGPYAIGHGLGLSLHDRPFFYQMNKYAGIPP